MHFILQHLFCFIKIDKLELQDQNGSDVYEDGELLIHTDGTGYISEDIAMKCPKDFYNAKFIKDEHFEVSALTLFLRTFSSSYSLKKLRIFIDHH